MANSIAQLVSINDTWLPCITKYRVDAEDIDASGTNRGETGVMHRARLREKVKKVSITCRLDSETKSKIFKLIKDTAFEMKIYCPEEDDYYEGTFYVSKYTSQLLVFHSKPYWEFSFNAIEY
ncbi:MAG: DUF6711 family protein [Ruminiclostridium sp.]